MKGKDIKELIDKKYEMINSYIIEGQFVFHPQIPTLHEEIRMLQSQCDHEFKNGHCIYCYKEEG